MTSFFKTVNQSKIDKRREFFYNKYESNNWIFIEANPLARFNLNMNYVRIVLKKDDKKLYLETDEKCRIDKILKDTQLKIKPWRENGDHILFILNSCRKHGYSLGDVNLFDWVNNTIKTIRDSNCERTIKIRFKCCIDKFDLIKDPLNKTVMLKQNKMSLLEDLENAWCSVLYSTSACVISIIQGIPVFCEDENTISYKISSNDYSQIENPKLENRDNFFNDFARQIWSIDEITNGTVYNNIAISL